MPHLIFLLIEYLDEFVFGIADAAWPLIRTDLGLTYVQVGLALSLPSIIGNLVEPFLGILGDVWRRRLLILAGGIFFALALALTGASHTFALLLFSFILFNPSSGAFVSLSQATLMDLEPERHEQNMARWTFAGSLGVFTGPLLLGGFLALGWGWRPAFWALAALTTLFLFFAWKQVPHAGAPHADFPSVHAFLDSLREALAEFKRPEVVRWLVLLEFSDLMLDVLYGFLALYFVDVAGFKPAQGAIAVAVWTGVGLAGDFLLIPLVERVRGLAYLRWSVLLELVLFPAFLLVQNPWAKLMLVGLLGFFNTGWYAILSGRLYSNLPGRSGTVLVLSNLAGLLGRLVPLAIGLAAQAFGLGTAMWLLLAGPLALLVGLPHSQRYNQNP